MRHDPNAPIASQISFDAFLAIDSGVGEIVAVEPLIGARSPGFRLVVNFGAAIGHKRSCAHLTQRYTPESLIGRRILAVVIFSPRQIGRAMSDVLPLGAPDKNSDLVLVSPDADTPLGRRLF